MCAADERLRGSKRGSWRLTASRYARGKRLVRATSLKAPSSRAPQTEPFGKGITTADPGGGRDPGKPRATGTAPSGLVRAVVARPATYAGN
nr:MAG TPA: hypothetical protein [Caudoviricetes sp.]